MYKELCCPKEDKIYGRDRKYVLQYDYHIDAEKFAKELRRLPQIEEAYPNYLYDLYWEPNDTYYEDQWSLSKIDMPEAWNITLGDTDVKIAIFDSGIDLNHPDLSSKISTYKRDFVDLDIQAYEAEGYSFYSNRDYTIEDNSPDDYFGHGTTVSGVAAAATNTDPDRGIAGVAPNCKIVPIRVASIILHPVYGEEYKIEEDDLQAAMYWAINTAEVDVINCSFGKGEQSNINDYQSAYNDGIVIVAATGNENTSFNRYPAAFNDYVIAVGATEHNDIRCDPSHWGTGNGSNYGPMLDVMAPGWGIYVTTDNGGYFPYGYGTSLSSPMVAGVAALIKSHNNALSPAQIRKRIENSCEHVGGVVYNYYSGKNMYYGHGRVNAYYALKYYRMPSPEYASLSTVFNEIISGQIARIDGSFTLDNSYSIATGKELHINSGANLDLDVYNLTINGGTMLVSDQAIISPNHIEITDNGNLKSLYPTLSTAFSAVSSGQIVELHDDYDLSSDFTVPVGKTLRIMSDVNLTISNNSKLLDGLGTLIIEEGAAITPDIRLMSGASVIGLYPDIASAYVDGNTIQVRSDLTFSDNYTLTSTRSLSLKDGALVKFPANKYLYVEGTLNCDDATFTSSSGTWKGIKYKPESSGTLDNATITNATYGVFCDSTSITVKNSDISNCTYGIYCYEALYSTLSNNDISGTTYDIYNYDSSPRIKGNDISGAPIGLYCDNGSSPELYSGDNYFHNSYVTFGVWADDASNPHLGDASCSIDGNNSFVYSMVDVAHVHAGTNCAIPAENNWWGTSSPSGIASGSVDWNPYLSSMPSYSVPQNPETDLYDQNISFASITPEDNGDKLVLNYDKSWSLKQKVAFLRYLYTNEEYSGITNHCKDIINDYPESLEAFTALDLMYQITRKPNIEKDMSVEDLMTYLVGFENKKGNAELNGMALSILAGFEGKAGLDRMPAGR